MQKYQHLYIAILVLLGSYRYREGLLKLDPRTKKCDSQLLQTPLQWQEWLAAHPDQCFRSYIVNGIKHDFRVGLIMVKLQIRICSWQRSNHK